MRREIRIGEWNLDQLLGLLQEALLGFLVDFGSHVLDALSWWTDGVALVSYEDDARYSPDETMFVYAHAPNAEGPWQICVQKLNSEDEDFVQLTSEGSNLQPDWSANAE